MLTSVLNCPSAYQNDIELKNQSVSMSEPAVKRLILGMSTTSAWCGGGGVGDKFSMQIFFVPHLLCLHLAKS